MEHLDLPAQGVQLDDVPDAEVQVVGHEDFDVVGRGSGEAFFHCRKDEPGFANRFDPLSFLVGVKRPGFRFRPDPMAAQTPVDGVRALARSEPDGVP